MFQTLEFTFMNPTPYLLLLVSSKSTLALRFGLVSTSKVCLLPAFGRESVFLFSCLALMSMLLKFLLLICFEAALNLKEGKSFALGRRSWLIAVSISWSLNNVIYLIIYLPSLWNIKSLPTKLLCSTISKVGCSKSSFFFNLYKMGCAVLKLTEFCNF